MKQRRSFAFIVLFATLLGVLSFSKSLVDAVRGQAIAVFVPLWSLVANGTEWLSFSAKTRQEKSQYHQLQVENSLLRNECHHLELLLKETVSWNRSFNMQTPKDEPSSVFDHLEVMPAKVIYRALSSWNSSLWINVGSLHNQPGMPKIVAQNSPVVVGHSLVGVIDYVGSRQSRVCLLTDSSLVPSVRAARGAVKDKYIAKNIAILRDYLMENQHLANVLTKLDVLLAALESLQHNLQSSTVTQYLAKGELHGSAAPLWRSAGTTLKGMGFNCDYADEMGPARDLRRGTPYDSHQNAPACSLLQVHDLLVTTGMDGIFPAGLHVAEVTFIAPLKEGDYYYEILAKPTAGNLDELEQVIVLPPCSYSSEDQPF